MNIENLYLYSTTTIATSTITVPDPGEKFSIPLTEITHAPTNPSITYQVIAHGDEFGDIKTIDYVVIQNARQKTETIIDVPFILFSMIAIIMFLSFIIIFRKKNAA